VDLVQEGGGTLGIALVGYAYVLEQAGIRFYSMAGTSAGAINTMMMAAYQRPGETISEKVLKLVSEKDLFELVDGRHKKLIDNIIKEKTFATISRLVFTLPKLWNDLTKRKGLNPGNNFLDWIKSELRKSGVETIEDIYDKQNAIQKAVKRRGSKEKLSGPKMAIITSDVTTHSKIELPKMDVLFWKEVGNYHPAELVRASMSIPFFFFPFTVTNVPHAGQVNDPNWDKHARYYGEVPDVIRFVDGGMLSNFPINIFHAPEGTVPSRPTFGARLSTYRKSFTDTSKLMKFLGGMVSTMRQIHDYDFILKNPDYRKLICNIDADAQYNWLNFNLTAEEQKGLFKLGAEKAIEFLEEFKWEEYKQGRTSD
jgi:NTE family protein